MASVIVRIRTLFSGQGANRARRALGGLEDQVIRMGVAFAAGFAVDKIAELAVETFNAAEAAKVATSAFTNLSGSASSAALNLAAMETATRGLVSETRQMELANQLLGMRTVQTAAELEKVARVSRRLGKAFRGMGAEQAGTEFAIMMSNMSIMRLDNFGLSSGRVRRRIIELMAVTKDMTREQAFFQAAMEEGENTLSRLGPELTTTKDELARMGAEFSNLQVTIGTLIEKGGAIKSFFKGIADNIALFNAAIGDTPGDKIAVVTDQIARQEEAVASLKSEGEAWLGFFSSQVPMAEDRLKSLKGELSGLLDIQGELTRRGEAEQSAMVAREAAEERSSQLISENIAKEKERAETLAQVQEDFSRDIIDLQNDTQDSLDDAREEFNSDELGNEEDHLDALADIREDADADRAKLRNRLSKDLAKGEKNLRKSLAKLEVDQTKASQKLQKETGKKDIQERRRKQINTLGDERLFQFGLRQLEADGNGIAIRDALERREIEQQIASEKASFEETVEDDRRKTQAREFQDEGRERRQQLKDQSSERSDEIKARNREEIEALNARIIEEIADENEGFIEKQADLAAFYDDRVNEIREGETEGVAEIAKALTEAEDLTNSQLDKMVALAGEFGKDFGTQFANGMTEAFSEEIKIGAAIAAVMTGGLGMGGSGLASGGAGASTAGGVGIFQQGGVQPGSPNQAFPAVLHGGEVVANPNAGQAVVIDGRTFAVNQAAELAGAINAQTQRNFQEFTNTLTEVLG